MEKLDIDLALNGTRASSRVVVAMSGGVDSSVTAAMLVEAGYDVVGITLQLYDHGAASNRKGACCAGQDIYDARRVAERLGIAHYVLDYESRFRDAVMEDFADSYLAGETPIPCVRCNQRVKFRDLLDAARDLGAEALATGHYARRVAGVDGPALMRAADLGRDQSYFLFATTKEQLDFLRFPLGSLTKSQTRGLANRYDLPVADKPDSQDICFVPTGGYAQVVEKLRPGAAEPGEIVLEDGTKVGTHDGVIGFTVGQRRGLGIAWPEPLYVLRLDPGNHRVIVGPEQALFSNTVTAREVNWLIEPPADGHAATVKLRHQHDGGGAIVTANQDGGAKVLFNSPQKAIAPGQAAVFYDGERVLGGGWIARDSAPTAFRASANNQTIRPADPTTVSRTRLAKDKAIKVAGDRP